MFPGTVRKIAITLTQSARFATVSPVKMAGTRRDPTTLSNYDKWLNRHITANLDIDFKNKRLSGSVDLRLESVSPAKEIILDTSHLDVKTVKVNGAEAKWELLPRSEPNGSPLKIQTEGNVNVGTECNVTVGWQSLPLAVP